MVEEDEIDLRPYLMTILRHWKLIGGITIVMVVLAAAASLATPASYEATATVAITSFGANPAPDVKTYLQLTTGGGVMEELGKQLASSFGGTGLSTAQQGPFSRVPCDS